MHRTGRGRRAAAGARNDCRRGARSVDRYAARRARTRLASDRAAPDRPRGERDDGVRGAETRVRGDTARDASGRVLRRVAAIRARCRRCERARGCARRGRAGPRSPAVSELVSAEVQAMFALHRVGMTAEDDIAVERHESTIDVSGLTTTAARRRQLTDAIASIKHVRVRIQTTDEALAELSGRRPRRPWRARPTLARPRGRRSCGAGAPLLRMDEAAVDATRLPVQALAEQGQSRPGGSSGRRGVDAPCARGGASVADAARTRVGAAAAGGMVTTDERQHGDREHARADRPDGARPRGRRLESAHGPRHHGDANASGSVAGDVIRSTTDTRSRRRRPMPTARGWTSRRTSSASPPKSIATRAASSPQVPTPTTEAADEARRLRHGLDRAARSLLELRQPHAQPQP